MSNPQAAPYQRDWKASAAVFLMLAAGIIHLIIIPHHMEHAPAHGIALGVFGVFEIAWAVVYWLKPSRKLAQLGSILAISLIALWVITRFAPAPFTNEAEEIDFAGVISKIMEGISAILLLAVVVSTPPETGSDRTRGQTILYVLILSILLAIGIYEAAFIAQALFPQLGPPAGEHNLYEIETGALRAKAAFVFKEGTHAVSRF